MDERRSVISQNWKHHSQQQTLSTIAISNRWGVIASACAYHRYLPVSHPPLPLVSHLLYTWNAADCGRRTVRTSSSRHSTTTAGSVCNSPQPYFDTGAGSVISRLSSTSVHNHSIPTTSQLGGTRITIRFR